MSIIEIKHLSKKFSGTAHKYVLRNIDLTIHKGDVFGIVGTSGAGKSTLMRCLTGLEKPSEGLIAVEGESISSKSPRELISYRRRIGMVFQQFNLFPSKTVGENIAFPLDIHGVPIQQQQVRVEELLHLVGLPTKKNVYPATLSGGEKQRVGIARALAHRPNILFCDEATSALDPTSTRAILNLLQELNETLGLTLVLITHQMDAIKQICNRVAVLAEGMMIEQGEVADIFANPKSSAAKHLLQPLAEKLPQEFFLGAGANRKLVNLTFMGKQAKEPVICQLIKKHDIEVNILLANIESLQKTTLGSLIVELKGEPEALAHALCFLENSGVICEGLE